MSEANLIILLIEDNAADADLLTEMLADEEHRLQVVCADCMAAAESYLKSAAADAILLDLTLPDSDGLASLERAASAAPICPSWS